MMKDAIFFNWRGEKSEREKKIKEAIAFIYRESDECLIVVRHGVLRKLKHIFPNTYQRIKSICSPAKGGTGCYRFNYQPGS